MLAPKSPMEMSVTLKFQEFQECSLCSLLAQKSGEEKQSKSVQKALAWLTGDQL